MKSDCALVVVTWLDSAQPTSSWQWLNEIKPKKPIRCYTVGWIIQDTDEVKVLAQSIGSIEGDEAAQTTGVMTIPTRCIEKVEKLETGGDHPERIAAE